MFIEPHIQLRGNQVICHSLTALQVSIVRVDLHEEAKPIHRLDTQHLQVICKSIVRFLCVLFRYIAEHTFLKFIVVHADKVDNVCGQRIELSNSIRVCNFSAGDLSAIPVYLGYGSDISCIFDTVEPIDISEIAVGIRSIQKECTTENNRPSFMSVTEDGIFADSNCPIN